MLKEKSGFNLASAWLRARKFIATELWQFELSPRGWTAGVVSLLQFSIMVAQGFVNDRLLVRASALTFVTALSMIPLLVVIVALIGIVGGEKSMINLIVNSMTAVSPEATSWVTSRIQEVDIRNLGSLGGATLILSAIFALRHLESTLGEIWGVHQSRSWPRRFADYLAVLVVAPILTGVAVSLWASVGSENLGDSLGRIPLLGDLYQGLLLQLPQLVIWLVFAFLYWFFPNTRVRPSSAILGALVATILLSVTRILYVGMGIGAAKYSVLFGGLVALPLVLTWIYVCWSVVLFGAEVAFAHQNLAHYREDRLRTHLPPAEREGLAVTVMLAIAKSFKNRRGPKAADELSTELDLSVRVVREILEELEGGGLVVRSGNSEKEAGFLPSCPLSDTTVADVILTIRGERRQSDSGRSGQRPVNRDPLIDGSGAAVEAILTQWEDALRRVAGSHTLAELVTADPDAHDSSKRDARRRS
jgi:membrane protein